MVRLDLRRPTLLEEEAEKQEAARRGLNYSLVGETRKPIGTLQRLANEGWNIDHVCVQVGKGNDAYKRAKSCLEGWGQFQLGWTTVDPATPVTRGALVAVTAKTLFLWSCNPLKIVYVDQPKVPRIRLPWHKPAPRSFSFAHGCLKGHMLTGEESFTVEQKADGSVWYEVRTFSKAVHPLAVITYPLTRYYQRKFGQDSKSAVIEAATSAAT